MDFLKIKTHSFEVEKLLLIYQKFSYSLDHIEEKDNYVILHLKRNKNIKNYKQIKKLERTYFHPLRSRFIPLLSLSILTFIALTIFIIISFIYKDVYSLEYLLLCAGLPALIIFISAIGYSFYFVYYSNKVVKTYKEKKASILKEVDNLK